MRAKLDLFGIHAAQLTGQNVRQTRQVCPACVSRARWTIDCRTALSNVTSTISATVGCNWISSKWRSFGTAVRGAVTRETLPACRGQNRRRQLHPPVQMIGGLLELMADHDLVARREFDVAHQVMDVVAGNPHRSARARPRYARPATSPVPRARPSRCGWWPRRRGSRISRPASWIRPRDRTARTRRRPSAGCRAAGS